jgi:hypothetical protein
VQVWVAAGMPLTLPLSCDVQVEEDTVEDLSMDLMSMGQAVEQVHFLDDL